MFAAIRSSLLSSLAADRLARLILEINIRERLFAVIADDQTCGLYLDGPGRREAAGGHSRTHIQGCG